MAKLTLNNITAGYNSATQINANNDLIETALENTLSRDGTTPNTMSADLDLNSNDILNVENIQATGLILNGTGVTPSAIAATPAASAITITDAGGYYSSGHVEGALQEGIGAINALAKTDGNFIVGNGSTWVAESGATARASLGIHQYSSKSSGYTVVAADHSTSIVCTADLTLTLTAAATLGSGFEFTVVADGGVVTIDPNSSETVGGHTTLPVYNGAWATFVCDGSNWEIKAISPMATEWISYSSTKYNAAALTVPVYNWVTQIEVGFFGLSHSGGVTNDMGFEADGLVGNGGGWIWDGSTLTAWASGPQIGNTLSSAETLSGRIALTRARNGASSDWWSYSGMSSDNTSLFSFTGQEQSATAGNDPDVWKFTTSNGAAFDAGTWHFRLS